MEESGMAHRALAAAAVPALVYGTHREEEEEEGEEASSTHSQVPPVPVPTASCLTTLQPPPGLPVRMPGSERGSEAATQPLPAASPEVEGLCDVGQGEEEQQGGAGQEVDYDMQGGPVQGAEEGDMPPSPSPSGSPGPAGGIPRWLDDLVSDANSDVSHCSSRARAAAALPLTHGHLDQDHLQLAPFAFHLKAVLQGAVSWGEPDLEAQPVPKGGEQGGEDREVTTTWAGARYRLLHPTVAGGDARKGGSSLSVLCTLKAPPGGSPHAPSVVQVAKKQAGRCVQSKTKIVHARKG